MLGAYGTRYQSGSYTYILYIYCNDLQLLFDKGRIFNQKS